MRLSLRFLLPLILAMTVLAYVVVPLVDSLMLQWFVRDLDMRAQLVAGTLQKPLATLVPEHDRAGIEAVLNGSIHDDRAVRTGILRSVRQPPVSDQQLSKRARLQPAGPTGRPPAFRDSLAARAAARDAQPARCRRPEAGRTGGAARHEFCRAAQRRYAQVCDSAVRACWP